MKNSARSSARFRVIGHSDRRWHRRDAGRSPFSLLSGKESGLDDEPAGDVTPATAFGGALPYTKIHTRFLASVILGLIWICFSFWLAQPWFNDLSEMVNLPFAIFAIFGIAIIPGYLNAYLVASLLLDRPRALRPVPVGKLGPDWPGVTLIIAAWNEAESIKTTLECAARSDYPGNLEIIVADDGSTDTEARMVQEFSQTDPRVRLLPCVHGGKAAALNAALGESDTEVIATVDADTLLTPQCLHRAVARLVSQPSGTAAVAGAVMARNSRQNWVTRLQEWDYQMGIASIKRSQAVWQATLVTQGAFSVYRRDVLVAAEGWPDAIGEDIVLTWSMLDAGWSTGFEPTAIAFTDVPTSYRALAHQRSRWARGMIEGLREYGPGLIGRGAMVSHGIAINYLFVWMDLAFSLVFLPGLILAMTGNFAIVGPWTLAVIPLNLLIAWLMFRMQRHAFEEVRLSIRRNITGFVLYVVFFQMIVSPAALRGYFQETFRLPRDW